jgi:hypothetical protein
MTYTEIYNVVHSSLEKDEVDRTTFHVSSVRITDSLWELYTRSVKEDLVQTQSAIVDIVLKCFN